MSFYTDASLVLIPSGYKDQKVYSAKPVDGSGDLTFSRASSATRVNSSGLVEKVRTNLATYSNDFSNAIWQKDGGTSLTANAGTDPNGGNDAWEVVMPSGGNLYQNSTPSWNGAQSVYAKVASGTESIKLWNGVSGTTFNLTTSWQRISVINVNAGQYINVYNDSGSSVTFLIAFAQAETGDIATDYIATTSAAVSVGPVSGLPRLDYSGGATCPSLLLEPQRTNLFTYSEQLNTGTSGATATPNQAVSPDGYTNADLITGAGANNYIAKGISGAFSGTHTFSIFLKAGTDSNIGLDIYDGSYYNATYNLATGVATGTGASMVSYGNGWYRCILTRTTSANPVEVSISAIGDGLTIYAWGGQFEANASYATSYIPTLSTAVTRVADYSYKTGISSLIGQTEGTIYAEVNFDISVNQTFDSRIHLTDGGYTNWIFMGVPDGGSGNLPRFYVVSPSGTTSFYSSTALSQGINKLAFGYKNGDMVAYLNGAQVASNTSAQTMPTTSQIYLQGGSIGSGANERTNYKQVLLFTSRLSNADLATLTTL